MSNGTSTSRGHLPPHSPASKRARSSISPSSDSSGSANNSSSPISRCCPKRSSSQRWNAVPRRACRAGGRGIGRRTCRASSSGSRASVTSADTERLAGSGTGTGPSPRCRCRLAFGEQQPRVEFPRRDKRSVGLACLRGRRSPLARWRALRVRAASTRAGGLADGLVVTARRGGRPVCLVHVGEQRDFLRPRAGCSAQPRTVPAPASHAARTSARNTEGPERRGRPRPTSNPSSQARTRPGSPPHRRAAAPPPGRGARTRR